MNLARIVATLASLALCACGGGGGGGPTGGNFTLSRSAISYTAQPNGVAPAPVVVRMHLTDDKTIYVGAGYLDVPDPGWLSVEFQTLGPQDIDVIIVPVTTALAEGTHTTVLSVGTANDEGEILQTRDISIQYTIDRPVSLLQGELTLPAFVLGHAQAQYAFPVAADAGAGDSYTVSSNAAWLVVPDTVFTASQNVPATADVTGLPVGSYTATLTSQNTQAPAETDTQMVHVTVVAPQLTVDTAGVLLGGSSGLDTESGAIAFSLDTGDRAHPWTATLTTDDGASWLLAGSASGEVSGAGLELGVDADRAVVSGGTYTGSVTIDVDVDGYPLSATVPVTLNKEAERLLVTHDGVALAQLPSRELLTREVRVLSTLGRDGAAWSASSDQDWLEVTASGGTGGALTLTANPLLLAADTLHVAQVSIASDDPLIENTQGIRVGLWIGSADPGVIALPDGIERTVMDPVAPWLYAHSGADLVSVYNVYTGELVTSYAAGTSAPGGMAASSDGLKLFVADTATGQAFELSAADGTPVQTYTPPFQTANADLAYARPDALPTLLFGNTYAADAATGEFFEAQLGGSGTIAVAADQRVVFLHNTGTSPSTATRQELRRTVLDGGALRVENRADFFPGSNGQDAALAPDGARFYAASGGYYAFPVYDGVTREFIEDLAGAAYPNNAEVAWNGVFAGGASAYYDAVDLWFYDAAGAVLGTERCFGSSYSWLVRDSIRFSGDALRYACSAGPDVWGEGATLRIRDVPGS